MITAEDWEAYHSLRRAVLWGRDRTDLPPYDPKHPHEFADGHYPLLFCLDDRPVGTIRVDIDAPVAWFRLVAIAESEQGRGAGRQMLELAGEFARSHGCEMVRCNVDPDAVGFYEKLGFTSTGESAISLRKRL